MTQEAPLLFLLVIPDPKCYIIYYILSINVIVFYIHCILTIDYNPTLLKNKLIAIPSSNEVEGCLQAGQYSKMVCLLGDKGDYQVSG